MAASTAGQSTFFYAQYLGVDLHVHSDLIWLIDSALCAPLPGGWIKDRRGDQVFYHNAKTKVSTWAHPLEEVHKDVGGKIIRMRGHDMSKGERSLVNDHLQRKYVKLDLELKAVVCIKERGERQFQNQVTKHVYTTDPRPAITHVMSLYEQAMTAISEQPPQSHHPPEPRAMASVVAATSRTRFLSGSSGLSRSALQRSASEVVLPAMGGRTAAKHREEILPLKANLLTHTTDLDVRGHAHPLLKTTSSVRLEPIDLAEEAELLE
eukprot:CAMPEP_0172750948 /NCGR_PEP_ID=MMETSP1074-20121228/150595_1 /TAXON_ID=2916 /ORGANISM="Ceratium fusus, Strain PA161109" /LENGTH=264 /DNA_ID=CAMNT_0013583167 /DNA_START=30 /DNA_END=824 /DNA_ORIENTATION=-